MKAGVKEFVTYPYKISWRQLNAYFEHVLAIEEGTNYRIHPKSIQVSDFLRPKQGFHVSIKLLVKGRTNGGPGSEVYGVDDCPDALCCKSPVSNSRFMATLTVG